jgi:hypothetical protein
MGVEKQKRVPLGLLVFLGCFYFGETEKHVC